MVVRTEEEETDNNREETDNNREETDNNREEENEDDQCYENTTFMGEEKVLYEET